ncbi:MAG: Gfo/Idh/MocA family oxidoreductase [Rhodospirillales bacterium]|nr:Gfo/Idh/MocA family oxidoreductase [Rhodospirillales bacterium]MBO6787740.1 Gfo/Idh/MocA family oxidoreductase [Rhodospirillales bacterium]
MKALVIGYGSIGQRHAGVLAEMGHDVAVVSRRDIDHPANYKTLTEAVDAFRPDYVVVASKTGEHRDDLEALSQTGFRGRVLIEKPVYDSGSENPPEGFEAMKVAFNLRFHPALRRFRDVLGTRKIFAAHIYTGSYLPDWRPYSDYRKGYSANHAEGGGVLRDLSHEIDYMMWLFGDWRRVAAIGGRFGDLEIDSDDVFSMLIETDAVPSVTLGINYLDNVTRREVLALTDKGSVRLDLVRGTVEQGDDVETFTVARNDAYIAQHEAMIANDSSVICDIAEGLKVMRLIDAAERSAADGRWVPA